MTGRLSRGDWLAIGLERLAAEGPAALQLEHLCAAAARTRGSFYHHFESHGEFLNELGEHWRREHTEVLIDLTQSGTTVERLRSIKKLATLLDSAVETGMRRLGVNNPRIQRVVADVDRRRVEYMTRLHRSRPGVSDAEAARFARLEYAAMVGGQVLWPQADATEVDKATQLLDDCISVFAAGGGSHGSQKKT